jgi:hypothetical protein
VIQARETRGRSGFGSALDAGGGTRTPDTRIMIMSRELWPFAAVRTSPLINGFGRAEELSSCGCLWTLGCHPVATPGSRPASLYSRSRQARPVTTAGASAARPASTGTAAATPRVGERSSAPFSRRCTRSSTRSRRSGARARGTPPTVAAPEARRAHRSRHARHRSFLRGDRRASRMDLHQGQQSLSEGRAALRSL